jgi:hypothetical protein
LQENASTHVSHPPSLAAPRTTAAPAGQTTGRSLAEQLAPVLRVHEAFRAATRPVVNAGRARLRIDGGRPGFDPHAVLDRTPTLVGHFARAVDALELAGLVSSTIATAVRRAELDSAAIAAAWVAGDGLPPGQLQRSARHAAGIVAGAVLRRNAGVVLRGAALDRWTRPVCPCCGGLPDLSFVAARQRMLVCARCDTRWRTDAKGCLGCDVAAAPTFGRLRTPYPGYELVICNGCGRYLKERRGALRYHPLVERAITAEMDTAAERRGLRL